MRKITPDQFIVYKFDELELPGARERAIERLATSPNRVNAPPAGRRDAP